MSGKEIIRKIVKKEIDGLFEALEFQADSARQLGVSMALNKLPRKGIDDSINNFNQVEFETSQQDSEEEREEELNNRFKDTSSNAYTAPTLTNLYEEVDAGEEVEINEDAEINEDIGVNASASLGQDNLDFDRGTRSPKASLGAETAETVKYFNDNIDRALNQIKYPGNTNDMFPPANI